MRVLGRKTPSPGFVSYCLFAANRPFFFLTNVSNQNRFARVYKIKDVPINNL